MSENTITLQIDRYIVERSANAKIRVDIPKHEVKILQLVHGDPKNVRLVEENVDEREFPISAGDEYDRLKRTYARTNAPNPVEFFYRNGPEDLRQFGFVIDGEVKENPEAERVINPREAAHKAKKKAALGKKSG